MNVVPVCECPKCHKLGLHYMAEVDTEVRVETKKWTELVEVPGSVMWYDEREKEPMELRVKYHFKETKFYTECVVRECWYCSHVFYQYWKEWYE